MTKKNPSLTQRFVAALGSSWVFWAILSLLVLQAAWIALSGRYPMAFDEDFHLGIIRLYAHHSWPLWSGQPANADMFGAVARDPSYLYHFLMSFPYRLINLFTGDQTIQVIILRFMNIGLFSAGIVLYRRLLLKTGASKALVNFCLLTFVLIPIVPLLAAQINYDNLLLPMTAMALLLTIKLDKSIAGQKKLDIRVFAQLLVVCLLASLVKYAFLPIFAVITGFLAIRLIQNRRSKVELWRSLTASWHNLATWLKIGIVALVIMSGGMFVERYGINLARYGEPVPDCGKVLTIKQCSSYGAWIRDYNYKIANLQGPRSPVTFTKEWLYGMWLRTFFAVDGPGTNFQTRGPLLIPGVAAIVFTAISTVALVVGSHKLLRRYDKSVIWLFASVTVGYVAVLWLDEYRSFLRTGHPVAINGRYLLPVLLPVLLMAAASVNSLVKNRPGLKLVVASSAMLCLVWGGGALTYILRSQDSWYWPNQAVVSANHAVKRGLGPITPGYDRPTEFLR